MLTTLNVVADDYFTFEIYYRWLGSQLLQCSERRGLVSLNRFVGMGKCLNISTRDLKWGYTTVWI